MGAAVYTGPFRREQAERLLWRAGFGPRKGEAAKLARLGLDEAVHSLTHPGPEKMVGPKPRDSKGRGLAPGDAWGHDQLWWLDRMVRTSRPLVERMTLVWHDWFATSLAGVSSQSLMLEQNRLLRRYALGSFPTLLREVTRDPAMLLWLSGHREHQVVAERELRTRADGALHPRGRQRLHRAGRARAGAGAHRVDERMAPRRRRDQLPLREEAPRRGQQAHLRQARRVRLGGRGAAVPRARPASRVLRRQAVELLRADAAGLARRAPRSSPCTPSTGTSGPSSERSSATRRSTPARGW